MSDSENVRQRLSELSHVITELSKELAMAWTHIGKAEERISELEDTVREHQIAVPHAESQA